MLGAVFWLWRGWPALPDCFTELSPGQREVVDRFRSCAVPIHIGVAAAVLAAVMRLMRPGAGTLAAGAYAVLLAATAVEPDVLAAAGVVQLFWAFATVPLVGIAILVTVAFLLSARMRRHAPPLALGVGWAVLLILVPAHFAGVWLVDDPFCMS